ncbi:MAG: FAD:protein FMN transferase, partial [Actinomycetota bacterium]|nr:FAD:protein FMN transferase [Actinomycetota bacterium]
MNLGGDIATAGPAPAGGWQVSVQDLPGEPSCQLALPGGAAVATSSTLKRTWQRGGRQVRHIVDPRTGQFADPMWRTISVVADTCLQANTLSTAAMVRAVNAPGWLHQHRLPARLVDPGLGVTT